MIGTANPILREALFILRHVVYDFIYSKVLLVFEGT